MTMEKTFGSTTPTPDRSPKKDAIPALSMDGMQEHGKMGDYDYRYGKDDRQSAIG